MRSKFYIISFIALVIFARVSAQYPPVIISQSPPSQMAIDMGTVSNLIKFGEIPRAIAILDRMRETYGDNSGIKTLYIQAYKAGKLYGDLERLIRDDLAKDPQNPFLLAELGEARFLQNDEAGADTLWNRSITFGRIDENIYRLVADHMTRYGLYNSAIDTYIKGRQNLDKPTIFSAELSNLYETQRDYPRAVEEFLIQVLEEPAQLSFVSIKVRGYLEDDDNPQQIFEIIISKIKEVPNRFELYEILGDLYIKSNQMDKALECYKTISIKQNDDGQALVKFALRAYDSKAFSAAPNAVDEYFRLSKKAVSKDMAILIKAKSQLASGQTDLALADFMALSDNASDPRTRDEAGLICGLIYAQSNNDCDSALLAWDKMQKTAGDPGLQGRARLEMAICYLKKDNIGAAENCVNQVMSRKLADSTMEKASFLLGEIAFFKANFKEAKDFFKHLVQNYPQGDHTNDALVRLEAISLSGEDEGNLKLLASFAQAMMAMNLGRSRDAARILSESVLGDSPIAEQAAFYGATAFADCDDKTDAIIAFKRYVEKYPDGLYIDRAYLGLGDLYTQDPNTSGDAKAAYDKILESFPNGPVTEVARQRLLQLTTPGKIG